VRLSQPSPGPDRRYELGGGRLRVQQEGEAVAHQENASRTHRRCHLPGRQSWYGNTLPHLP